MFVSALFKTVFHLIFKAKIMSMLEITFGISFICNDLDLTDILSKTENALSTAICQSEVRQLEKNIKFTVRQFASTCLSVKTPQITLNEHKNQPLQLQTTSCSQTHHTKHLSTKYGPAHDNLVLIAYSQKFYLICWDWRRSYGDLLLYLHPFALCMRATKALARLRGCTG